MADEQMIENWQKESLPGDEFSYQNALSIINSMKTPLIIDP